MIQVEGLVKNFGPIRAVRQISFQVEKGEVLGFLGPNGAGKSTTMKMLTCFIPPTAGTATVKGYSILKNPVEVREQIGYLPESAPLYEEMTVEEFLKFISQVRGFTGSDIQRHIDRVYEVCQIKGVRHQPIHTLSKGYRQRTCFAQALLHDPEILILDEPTDGLDPNQKHAMRELIRSMAEDKCIILSTHILEEVDAVCSRAVIISTGEMRFDGSPEELRGKSEIHEAVVVSLLGNNPDELKTLLRKVEGIKRIEQLPHDDTESIRLRCYPEMGQRIAPELVQLFQKEQIIPREFQVEKGRLDEVFRQITSTQ